MRTLTEGERTLARGEFGGALDFETIRLAGTPWPFDRAFVPGRWFGRDWVLWPARGLPKDFAVAPVGLQAVFIHELVHVWQAQQGVNLLAGKIRAGDGPSSYGYPKAPCGWDELNIEQQAMSVEHRFKAARGLKVPEEAPLYGGLCPIGSKSGQGA